MATATTRGSNFVWFSEAENDDYNMLFITLYTLHLN